MAGGSFVFTNAKGMLGHYGALPAAGDGLFLLLLREPYVARDADLLDLANLADLWGMCQEANFTGYARQVVTSVALVRDYVGKGLRVVGNGVTYVGVGGSGAVINDIWKALLCYDADTAGGTDATVIPLAAFPLRRRTTSNFTIYPQVGTSAYLVAR